MTHTPDIHGGNGAALAARLGISPEAVLDLSSNTFMAAFPLTQALLAHIPYDFANYPPPQALDFHKAAAAHESCPQASVLCGNGAAELIWLCFTSLRPKRVLMLGPMFSEYARACTALNIPFEVVTPPTGRAFEPGEDDYAQLRASTADMAILCLPNNPGGLTYANLPRLCEALGRRTILADLSYREFLYGTPPAEHTRYSALAQLCVPGARLIGLHSLTKFFCCPGIRLGYAVTDPATAETLRAMQPPWMLSRFAEQAACVFFEHVDDYRALLPDLRTHVRLLAERLAASTMFQADTVFQGVSFVSARTCSPDDAASMHEYLAQQGILTRLCDTIPGMPQGFLRIQARTPEELAPLYRALEHR